MQGRALGGDKMHGCEKVRAHQAIDDPDISPDERSLRVGNDYADRAAKLGAAAHPSADASTPADLDFSIWFQKMPSDWRPSCFLYGP
eukprot:1944975-Pyramimonas_sp.AAC.1